MNITVNREELLKVLSAAERAVGHRTPLNILTHILLLAHNDNLAVMATNLEIGVVASCPVVRSASMGGITVPAALFIEFVKNLSGSEVDLVLNPKTLTLAVHSGRSKANFKGMDVVEFPMVPDRATAALWPSLTIASDVLKSAAERVTYAAAREESRPILTTVYTKIGKDGLALCAVDGFRMALVESGGTEDGKARFIPATAFSGAARLMGSDEVTIRYNPTGTQVMFSFGAVDFTAQLIDGNFPDYQQIIPQSHKTSFVANQHELAAAIKRALLFTDEASNPITLTVEDHVVIASESAGMGDSSSLLEFCTEGPAMAARFNGRYLLDALNACPGDEATLEFNDPSSPCAIKGEGYTAILMPVHINK